MTDKVDIVNELSKWLVTAKFVINKTDNENFDEDLAEIVKLCSATEYPVTVQTITRSGFELCKVEVNKKEY